MSLLASWRIMVMVVIYILSEFYDPYNIQHNKIGIFPLTDLSLVAFKSDVLDQV